MIAGALLQAALSAFLPIRYALAPAGLLAFIKIADMYAMRFGWKANPHMMDDNITGKFSAQIPDKFGNFGNQPARDGVAVFLIGTRCNSPLGMLDKQFGKLGEYMDMMQAEIKADPEAHGYLGGSIWQGSERDANGALMFIMYFKSAADVHRYAHGPTHRKGWDWWYKNIKDLGEIGIYHELYEVPSGNYEAIYDHMNPMLLAATQHKVHVTSESGEKQEAWISPVVDARKGQLRSSRGRMARSSGTENEKYGFDDEAAYETVTQKV